MSARGLWQVQLSQYLDSVRAQGLVEGYSFGTPAFCVPCRQRTRKRRIPNATASVVRGTACLRVVCRRA